MQSLPANWQQPQDAQTPPTLPPGSGSPPGCNEEGGQHAQERKDFKSPIHRGRLLSSGRVSYLGGGVRKPTCCAPAPQASSPRARGAADHTWVLGVLSRRLDPPTSSTTSRTQDAVPTARGRGPPPTRFRAGLTAVAPSRPRPSRGAARGASAPLLGWLLGSGQEPRSRGRPLLVSPFGAAVLEPNLGRRSPRVGVPLGVWADQRCGASVG